MAKVNVNVKEPTDEPERKPLLGLTRNVLLASIGAVALAQDEMETFVNRLVERGEIAEQDGKKLIRDMIERRRRETRKAETEMETRIEQILNRMNVPTKTDIDALSAKITALTKKVDELKNS
jgi:poly(hydroxyalkanoate) granule-associated protein